MGGSGLDEKWEKNGVGGQLPKSTSLVVVFLCGISLRAAHHG